MDEGEHLVILTGMSGAGKSTALRCFEDLGYFCIDNLPPSLIATFVQLYRHSPGSTDNIAVVCDVRSGDLFLSFREAVGTLKDQGQRLDVLFIDCDDDTLVARFNETRRVHPLGVGLRLEQAVKLERERLDPLKELATHVVDTTDLAAGQLRERILGLYLGLEKGAPLTVTILSFGYKSGIPADADFVFDTRFLPNPFYVEELRELTGSDPAVRDYVMGDGLAAAFADSALETVGQALRHYRNVHKYSAVLALGCTGGKHRSVALAEYMAQRLSGAGYRVVLQHRDIERL